MSFTAVNSLYYFESSHRKQCVTTASLTAVPPDAARVSLHEFSLPSSAHGGLAGVTEPHRPEDQHRGSSGSHCILIPLRRREEPRRGEGSIWLCCADSNEHTTVRRGKILGNGVCVNTKMKAAGRQGTVTAEKLNGDMKRRPSYPGELRAKHANMSTKIWVKVALAIAYFLCVSVAAFILVIYYVFFWTPDQHNNITSTQAPNRTDCLPLLG
ncbi:uncharacterized protein [Pseudochaenichthys georgianus]